MEKFAFESAVHGYHAVPNCVGAMIGEKLRAKQEFDNPMDKFAVNPRGGGTPLYKLYRYVPPQRVWFLSRFGLKTGIDFDHYGLKSGMVYKGTMGAYKRICLFNSK